MYNSISSVNESEFFTWGLSLSGGYQLVLSNYFSLSPTTKLEIRLNPNLQDSSQGGEFIVKKLTEDEQKEQKRIGPLEEKIADAILVFSQQRGDQPEIADYKIYAYFLNRNLIYSSYQMTYTHTTPLKEFRDVWYKDLKSAKQLQSEVRKYLIPNNATYISAIFGYRRLIRKLITNSNLPESHKNAVMALWSM